MESIDIMMHDPVGKKYYKHIRNSEIQSFEFTIDTLWRFLKEYLLYAYKLNVDVPTPKKVFRECLNVLLIEQAEFDVLLAEEISRKIPLYYDVINIMLSRIKV